MAKLHLAQEILDIIYPVGSIYLSWNSTNPSTYFGGTWMQLKGGFLYGFVESPGTGNGTGTSTNSHTLTIDQIPSHDHFNWSNTDGFVTHCINYAWGNYVIVPKGSLGEVYNYQKPVSQGGGKGHSHAIPYIAVSVWRRTA